MTGTQCDIQGLCKGRQVIGELQPWRRFGAAQRTRDERCDLWEKQLEKRLTVDRALLTHRYR